ncbi:peptidase A4-like protein [Thermosporothrix hazakensis]|uniref:Peptidase A4-like protein n=2 Tax=Thermosporothrix TaxID=768650 RepID=A0A326TYY9_THEHA|nr:G1 family glutamic endopeptidase [Thermosporothrix hazakensis]PZW22469.1 peptidase A4-like protein [Thermosporothrix hazakensis]BBH86050.1 hypothetical protein KTC_08010 [Thermosporothrix sp. COM3]
MTIKQTREILLHCLLLCILLLAAACDSTPPSASPAEAARVHKVHLDARSGLQPVKITNEQKTEPLTIVPGEQVKILAEGTIHPTPESQAVGPEGKNNCQTQTLPVPSLPCYALIYRLNGSQTELAGKQANITTRKESTLSLGINHPNAQPSQGGYDVTIVTLPRNSFTGLWEAPTQHFLTQGTSLSLSVRAFARDLDISSVRFTAELPNQQKQTLCEATTASNELYTCVWNFGGQSLQSGPVTLSYTIQADNGNSLSNPDGTRSGTVRYAETQTTANYAGYAGTNLDQSIQHESVRAEWKVPAAYCMPTETSYTGIWAGMTANPMDSDQQSQLAQIITETDCLNGKPSYFATWQTYPAPPQRISKPVHAGDSIIATVEFHQNQFQLKLQNQTQHWEFSTARPGDIADTRFAECILEAPTFVEQGRNTQRLARFDSVAFTCSVDGKPIGDQPHLYVFQMNRGNAVAVITSPLDQKGSGFTVRWTQK